ncbi:hypothetical protein D3C86_1794340 [compost metagenome]
MVARRANTNARPIAPTRQIAQLNTEMEPTVARAEGSSAMPLPIMLPATTPVQAMRPIFLLVSRDIGSPGL